MIYNTRVKTFAKSQQVTIYKIYSYTVWENFAEQHLTRLTVIPPLGVGDSLGGTPIESP